jgi:sugar lactone lactonase YvrE
MVSGPLWDARTSTLHFVDIEQMKVSTDTDQAQQRHYMFSGLSSQHGDTGVTA